MMSLAVKPNREARAFRRHTCCVLYMSRGFKSRGVWRHAVLGAPSPGLDAECLGLAVPSRTAPLTRSKSPSSPRKTSRKIRGFADFNVLENHWGVSPGPHPPLQSPPRLACEREGAPGPKHVVDSVCSAGGPRTALWEMLSSGVACSGAGCSPPALRPSV